MLSLKPVSEVFTGVEVNRWRSRPLSAQSSCPGFAAIIGSHLRAVLVNGACCMIHWWSLVRAGDMNGVWETCKDSRVAAQLAFGRALGFPGCHLLVEERINPFPFYFLVMFRLPPAHANLVSEPPWVTLVLIPLPTKTLSQPM